MASKILNLSNLPARIKQAWETGYIPEWTMESFSQLLASDGAEKQIAGIIATAQRTFKTFTGRQLVSSFCGPNHDSTGYAGQAHSVFCRWISRSAMR